MACFIESHVELRQFVDRFDNFLFDCDGVIWHGEKLIPGVKEVMTYLRTLGKRLIFVTNNATKSRESFKAKFDRLGIQADLVKCLLNLSYGHTPGYLSITPVAIVADDGWALHIRMRYSVPHTLPLSTSSVSLSSQRTRKCT